MDESWYRISDSYTRHDWWARTSDVARCAIKQTQKRDYAQWTVVKEKRNTLIESLIQEKQQISSINLNRKDTASLMDGEEIKITSKKSTKQRVATWLTCSWVQKAKREDEYTIKPTKAIQESKSGTKIVKNACICSLCIACDVKNSIM